MTIPQLVDHSPGAMTKRARVYIYAGASRHLLLGLTILVTPWLYSASAFIPIFGAVPAVAWGWAMTIVGLVCFAGAFTRKADVARFGMVMSASVTVLLAAGVTMGIGNSWVGFYAHIGQSDLLDLLLQRPRIFPAELARRMMAPPSPFLPLLLWSISVKDYAMCAQPLRVPLEDYRLGAVPRTL